MGNANIKTQEKRGDFLKPPHWDKLAPSIPCFKQRVFQGHIWFWDRIIEGCGKFVKNLPQPSIFFVMPQTFLGLFASIFKHTEVHMSGQRTAEINLIRGKWNVFFFAFLAGHIGNPQIRQTHSTFANGGIFTLECVS